MTLQGTQGPAIPLNRVAPSPRANGNSLYINSNTTRCQLHDLDDDELTVLVLLALNALKAYIYQNN